MEISMPDCIEVNTNSNEFTSQCEISEKVNGIDFIPKVDFDDFLEKL
jgi:hypothetical protein